MAPPTFITNVIRRLKGRWGKPLTLIQVTRTGINAVSGEQSFTRVTRKVKKAIYLPQDTRRDMMYDLSFLASGVGFVYGGLYDRTHQRVIVDAVDLRGFELGVATKAVMEGSLQECDVKFMDRYNNGDAYILFIEGVVGVNNATA